MVIGIFHKEVNQFYENVGKYVCTGIFGRKDSFFNQINNWSSWHEMFKNYQYIISFQLIKKYLALNRYMSRGYKQVF
jgi:hypothetical protein